MNEKCSGGQGYGAEPPKSDGGIQDHLDSSRIWKKESIKDFLSWGGTQVTRFAFGNDNSEGDVEAGGDKFRLDTETPHT